jgi:hypothetical protein
MIKISLVIRVVAMRRLVGFPRDSRAFELIALAALTLLLWGVVYLNYGLSQ